MAKTRAVPRLASDTTRTYVGFALTMVAGLALPFVLVATYDDTTERRVFTADAAGGVTTVYAVSKTTSYVYVAAVAKTPPAPDPEAPSPTESALPG